MTFEPSQQKKQQVELLASIAITHDGTAVNKLITKKTGFDNQKVATYQYKEHTFDFKCNEIRIEDKVNHEKLYYYFAQIHMKITDGLLIITLHPSTAHHAPCKIITQLNATRIALINATVYVDSPTCHIELV